MPTLSERIRFRTASGLFACSVVAGCATMHAFQVPPPVPTIDFHGSDDFIITAPYTYTIGDTHQAITIPQGFVTDYASIPPWLRWLFPRQSDYSRAAAVHDYLYWSQICTKAQADNILMIAMKELHVSPMRRTMIYQGVHQWGQSAWNRDAAERKAGEPKVIPERYYSLATDHTWPQARQVLIHDHIKDPPFPQNPAACAEGNGNVVP